MKLNVSYANVWVSDQDEALAFYTEKLGMELRTDVTVPEMGNFRWLTVGPPHQPDIALALMDIPGPPVFEESTATAMRELLAKGALGAIFLTTDDCFRDSAELKARGVEFIDEPAERPYGVDAGIRDPSGNHLRLTEERVPAEG